MPEHSFPLWFHILDKWQSEGGLSLSFPFLVGACRRHDPAFHTLSAREALRTLVQAMIEETPKGSTIVIGRHTATQQACVKIVEEMGLARMFRSATQDRDTVSVQAGVLPLREPLGVDRLVEGLWSEIGPALSEERYSYGEHGYGAFTGEDLEFIDGIGSAGWTKR